ncbi:MAG: VWA domain-containing protein [Sandaracinus sp.]|nr:VWA domain-containing protein [Sandaracinus sp.]
MDAERRRDQPSLALALVIDRSGSMNGQKIELAKDAAKATAELLSSDDYLEVIGFDSQPERIVRMQSAANRVRILRDISRLARARRHRDLPRPRRGVPRPRGHARAAQARHPADRRPGAGAWHHGARAGDARRRHHREHRRPRRGREPHVAAEHRVDRRRSLVPDQRPAQRAAHLHARDDDRRALGRGRRALSADRADAGGFPPRDERRERALPSRLRRDAHEARARAARARERPSGADSRAVAHRPGLEPRVDQRREEPLGGRMGAVERLLALLRADGA